MTTAQAERKTRRGSPRKDKATRQRGEQTTTTKTEPGGGVDVPVPVVTPQLRVYKLHMPTMGGHLPPPERLAFYGGLGATAIFGIIDWPVAAAIGIGTILARRVRTTGRPQQPQ
ncbi:hypothetical protein ACQPZP_05175 [Spirillospora sp. CA-142024]|uniref:hypothetical protein n=1 Tax=Spirillospora sp. CA-142024 TaxID=3240036 RepID=UPI003D8F790E